MMRTYILIVLLLLGVNTLTKAQKIPTAQEMAVKNVEELEQRLKLSPTQKSIIYNYVFELSKTQLDIYKKQQAGTIKEDEISKLYKFQNETNDNIRMILKGDQVAEFEKVTEERLNGSNKKKGKKGKEEQEVVTGISGLKMQP